jgi:hypothetical protein
MYDPVIGRWLVPDPYKQYFSPYLSMGNNPINLIDPNGGVSGDPKSNGDGGIINNFINIFKNFFGGLWNNSTNGSGDFQDLSDPEVVEEVSAVANTIETADYISKVESSPYVTVSFGKETSESSIFSGYQSFTITKYGIYGTTGLDATYGVSRVKVSGGLSGGLFFGRNLRSGIPGLGMGGSAGAAFVGLEFGRSINTHHYVVPSSWGNVYNVGFVISSSDAWLSNNVGLTYPIYTSGGWFQP